MLLPIAAIAPSSAMPVGTLCLGNSSRTTPKHNGKTPPPRPCSPRPTIIRSSVLAKVQTSEPTAKQPREIASRRCLPNMFAQAAEDRRGDARHEQVGGDQPGDVAGRRAERVL